jgi:hypothetical protein
VLTFRVYRVKEEGDGSEGGGGFREDWRNGITT